MLVGYARVSTNDQDTRLQLDALRRAGVQRVFQDKSSGVGPRPELHRAIESLRPGDVLVVWKLDRFARSLRHIHQVLDQVRAKGAGFRSLTEPMDTSSALGEFVLNMLASLAQFERSLIRERTFAGQVAAMRRGVRFGRERALSADDEAAAVLLIGLGVSRSDVARYYGVSRATIWRIEREARGLPERRRRLVFAAAFDARK